jgi:hypothetical protein
VSLEELQSVRRERLRVILLCEELRARNLDEIRSSAELSDNVPCQMQGKEWVRGAPDQPCGGADSPVNIRKAIHDGEMQLQSAVHRCIGPQQRLHEEPAELPLRVCRIILIANHAAQKLVMHFVVEPPSDTLNSIRLLFDPKLARPFIVDWERVAKNVLSVLQREVLINAEDERLRALLTRVQAYPDLPPGFRDPDLGSPSEATLTLRVKRDELELGFLTTMMSFTAPQNVTLEELRIESYFPLDGATVRTCERLARD